MSARCCLPQPTVTRCLITAPFSPPSAGLHPSEEAALHSAALALLHKLAVVDAAALRGEQVAQQGDAAAAAAAPSGLGGYQGSTAASGPSEAVGQGSGSDLGDASSAVEAAVASVEVLSGGRDPGDPSPEPGTEVKVRSSWWQVATCCGGMSAVKHLYQCRACGLMCKAVCHVMPGRSVQGPHPPTTNLLAMSVP